MLKEKRKTMEKMEVTSVLILILMEHAQRGWNEGLIIPLN